MKERAMVPRAEPEKFDSYYGKQIIKTPTWKTPDVPLYLFVGGMAGASALLAEGAAASGRPALERVARTAAAGGAAVGTVALIHDLGRPERFLNMLRVFKVTSPLSVGSFILAPFGGLSSAALLSHVTGRLPRLGRLAGVGTAVFGAPLATYTAALIANTAVPAWHEAHRELPFVFAGSGATAAGGLAMIATPAAQAGPARTMAVAGAALELAATETMHRRLGLVGEPYQQGRPGKLMQASKALTIGSTALTLLGGRSRLASVAAGTSYVAASLLTRFGIFEAGIASAKDPKYTVVPQKERARQRQARAQANGHANASPAPKVHPAS
jgi:formate-dependent nitrite reductase membrane component NrfD